MSGNGIAWCIGPDGAPGMSWNPVVGCSPVSAGCKHCWAAAMASRGLCAAHRGLAEHGRWIPGVGPRFLPELLSVPRRRRKPTGFAVALMGDLFHEKVMNEMIAAVYVVAAACPQHRFYSLTKRAARLPEWWAWLQSIFRRSFGQRLANLADAIASRLGKDVYPIFDALPPGSTVDSRLYAPLPNWWQLVSVEDQATADQRIPYLLRCPAAVRGISLEPMLGSVALPADFLALGREAWCIAGGESGPRARPCDIGWIRSIRDQCRAAGVPVFVKQAGRWAYDSAHASEEGTVANIPWDHPAGADPSEWPEDLRVREWPEVKP